MKPTSKPIVLVVDDFDEIRNAFANYVELLGCDAITAANGEEALKILRSGVRPSLIFLDLMMPVMDGWQTDQELANDPELSSIPTVIVTAVPERCHELVRPLEVLKKPADLMSIKNIIDRYCFKERMVAK